MSRIRVNAEGLAKGRAGSDVLVGNNGVNYLIDDKGGHDTLWGKGGADFLDAGRGNDSLYGGAGSDILIGGSGNDGLYGGRGNDILTGDTGNDILTGGSGRDLFLFAAKPRASNIDTITDFNVKSDAIWLEKSVFAKAVAVNGVLKTSGFWTGEAAHDRSDRIIYNDQTGALYYDPDGTGARAAVQFAALTAGLKLNHKDFLIL
jgi:Ca2+-binding RTX toxin-like protein